MLAAIGDEPMLGAAVDTGWWATQGYDPVAAIHELSGRLFHVHLKDVEEPGTHVTCMHGDGCARIADCVDDAPGHRLHGPREHRAPPVRPRPDRRVRPHARARSGAAVDDRGDAPCLSSAPGRRRRVRQHLRRVRRDDERLPVGSDRRRDGRRPVAERGVRRSLRRRRLPVARRRPRRSGRRRDRQPDRSRRPCGGDDRRPERRQARPQREAARRELRGRPLPRRPGGGPRAPALVLAHHVPRRGAADDVAARRVGCDRARFASRTPRSTGTGSRAGTLDRSPSTASGRSRTSACIRSRSSRPCSGPPGASPPSGRSSIPTARR